MQTQSKTVPLINHSLVEHLQKLGLSANEAKTYIALLTLGHGTVSEITKVAHLNRTTGYDILQNLVLKDLVSISGKEPKQEYVINSPDALERWLRIQLTQQNDKLEYVQKVIPQLKSVQPVRERPQIRFYEGKQGLIDVYEDTLTAHEPISAYATVDDMHKALPNYFPKYYRRRAQKKISIRAIIPATVVGKERADMDTLERRETALIPPDEYYFSPEINIYDNKVMIASWREELGIIIESAEIADAMKKVFKLAWAEAKRLDKKSR